MKEKRPLYNINALNQLFSDTQRLIALPRHTHTIFFEKNNLIYNKQRVLSLKNCSHAVAETLNCRSDFFEVPKVIHYQYIENLLLVNKSKHWMLSKSHFYTIANANRKFG